MPDLVAILVALMLLNPSVIPTLGSWIGQAMLWVGVAIVLIYGTSLLVTGLHHVAYLLKHLRERFA